MNEISRLSDVQIRNANAANYYECARMKEKKQQSLLGKRLTDFHLVPNGSQRFSMVLNGSQRYSTVLNGTQWLRMVSFRTAWFRPSGEDRQDRERECDENNEFARMRRSEIRKGFSRNDLRIWTPLRNFANLCESLRIFANRCESLRTFANLCESLRIFANRCESLRTCPPPAGLPGGGRQAGGPARGTAPGQAGKSLRLGAGNSQRATGNGQQATGKP